MDCWEASLGLGHAKERWELRVILMRPNVEVLIEITRSRVLFFVEFQMLQIELEAHELLSPVVEEEIDDTSSSLVSLVVDR